MKRIISLLLSLCLILEVCPVNVMASEIYTKYLKVSVDGEVEIYECLWDNKEIYCSVENLAEMSNYEFLQREIDDVLEVELFRDHTSDTGDYGIELQTRVIAKVADDKQTVKVEAMHESYVMNCYISDDEVFLPLEKLLYLLHAEWTIEDNIVRITPMPFTILDFMAIYSEELAQIASTPEDVLIDTGWWFSDNKWGRAVYSTVAEVFSDFDGKIFMIWWPGEGNVETAECYENAILQLARDDKEFIGEQVQTDAMEMVVNSTFALNNEYYNKIQNIMSVPGNIDEVVQSIPDAVSLLKEAKLSSKRLENIADQIDNGEIDTLFLKIPELESKVKELEEIGDGLAILQCVWNVYDTVHRVVGWNDEYLNQLNVLADYKNTGDINKKVVSYVRSSAKRLIDSYEDPKQAAVDEALQSTMGLLASKIVEESPFGKVFSIMGAIGTCYGTFNVQAADTYDVYSELSVVTFSIKTEQLVRELFRYEDLVTTSKKITNDSIEKARNQLMLYLRLNLRNKAQLYNFNVKGNKDKNWINSEEAKELYNEIVKVYAMIAELIETKDGDYRIILDGDLKNIHSIDNMDILLDEKPLLFSDIFTSFPQKFMFTSGVGAWDTQIFIEEDGTFTGAYKDSDFGEIYISNFMGCFSNLEKVDEYTYKLQLESIVLENTPGKVYYENGIKYICSEPYGLAEGKDFMLYLPGHNVTDLPDDFLGWVRIAGDVSEYLPFYGLYNVNEQCAFFSDIVFAAEPEPIESQENNNFSEHKDIIEVSEYLDSNPEELIELFDMQLNTPWQFGDKAESYKYDDFAVEWENSEYMDYIMTSAGLALNTEADAGRIYNISLYGVMLGMTGEEVKTRLESNGYIFLENENSEMMDMYAKNENGKRYGIHMQFYENQLVSWYWCNWREGEDLPDIDPYTYEEVSGLEP